MTGAGAAAEFEVYRAIGNRPGCDLAFESWLMERAAEGICCLSLWSWDQPTVVLGHGQPASDVDLDWCRGAGLNVLRRITGGTGVVHCRDLAVSLALPKDHPWSSGLLRLYGLFLDALEQGLRGAGSAVERLAEPQRGGRDRSPICFEDQLSDTLVVAGRKAVGCAQARRARSVLIHAAVLLNLDEELYGKVFRVDPQRVLRALAPAVGDTTWSEVADQVVSRLATALELDPEERGRPPVPEKMLAVYDQERWAPVRV